jgi:hypothetical protein
VSYSIGAGGGFDYLDGGEFFDDIGGVITDVHAIGLYEDETFEEGNYTINNDPNSATTDITLTCNTDHDGTATSSSGAIANSNTGGTWSAFNWNHNSTNGVIYHFTNFRVTGTSGSRGLWARTGCGPGDSIILHKMVIYRLSTLSSTFGVSVDVDDLDDFIIQNSVIHGFNFGLGGADSSGTNCLSALNVTIMRVLSGSANPGMQAVQTIKNCFVGGGYSTDYTSYVGTRVTSASSDTSGSAGLQSLTEADELVGVASGLEDLHIDVAGTLTLEDAGTDLGVTPADIEFDIDGKDRSSVALWDVGAHELESVGAPIQTLRTQMRMGM